MRKMTVLFLMKISYKSFSLLKIINFTEGDAAPYIIFLETDSLGYLREVKNENID